MEIGHDERQVLNELEMTLWDTRPENLDEKCADVLDYIAENSDAIFEFGCRDAARVADTCARLCSFSSSPPENKRLFDASVSVLRCAAVKIDPYSVSTSGYLASICLKGLGLLDEIHLPHYESPRIEIEPQRAAKLAEEVLQLARGVSEVICREMQISKVYTWRPADNELARLVKHSAYVFDLAERLRDVSEGNMDGLQQYYFPERSDDEVSRDNK